MAKAVDWAFTKRFRRGGFGRRGSRLACERSSEALAEIRAVARHDPALAAEGAVRFLVRLSPALEHVDSSNPLLKRTTGDATCDTVKDESPWLETVTAGEIVWADERRGDLPALELAKHLRTRIDASTTQMWFVFERLEAMSMPDLLRQVVCSQRPFG